MMRKLIVFIAILTLSPALIYADFEGGGFENEW